MVEASAEARNVPRHKHKIAFALSATRHFAERLRDEGLQVDFVRMNDPDNQQDLGLELAKAVQRHRPVSIVATEASEWRVWQMMQGWDAGAPLNIREDNHFFFQRTRCSSPSPAGSRQFLTP